MIRFHSPTIAILFASILVSLSQAGTLAFQLNEGDVVTFFGGANMLHLQQSGELEARLTKHFAAANPKFRDLSWEADTVFRQGSVIERWRKDGFGGLDDQIKRVGTTCVIAQFGQSECLAGADEEQVATFEAAYNQLVEAFQKQAKTVVLVTPNAFEAPASRSLPDLSQRNGDLAAYVEATERVASKHGAIFVNLFDDGNQRLTSNGMHVLPAAHSKVAAAIAAKLGVPELDSKKLEPIRTAVIEKHRLWYDHWRPANWKLLYGDDSKRVFTRGGENYIPFREEWKKLTPLIAKAEERIWTIADGGEDPGDSRPKPEVLHGEPDADIEKELASFEVADGMQVNLFASEKEGLTSPLSVRWDPAGRMYVTISTAYPHVFPGDIANDKVILLEDRDGDGTADHSHVFAEGLNIPTALECGEGGVFIGQNTEMLFLKDTDGDGRADTREVVLGGFGNGDSHQTINSFMWSPDGELFMGQGDGIESRVETPWGLQRVYMSGFARYRPRRQQLLPILDNCMATGNAWGTAFDAWGQIVSVDGAGGVNYLTPGLIPIDHKHRIKRIGDPGGYCGLGYVDGRALPEKLQGNFVTGDYKQNRVKRFVIKPDGAGVNLKWKGELLKSSHRNFRPVDAQVGPDGAIYVVDWYNPITCHQDDEYRHPTRDKAHGRIWRVSWKDAPKESIAPPDLTKLAIAEVLEHLKSPETWTREHAKRALQERDSSAVAAAIKTWVRSLDPKTEGYEEHLYNALAACATLEIVEPQLLGRLLNAADPRARGFAARIVGRWQDRLDDPLALLEPRVTDDDPGVRMEAVMACANIPSEKSIVVAAKSAEHSKDDWSGYAFKQACRYLQPEWKQPVANNRLAFAKPHHLAEVLNQAGAKETLGNLKRLVDENKLLGPARVAAVETILSIGDDDDAMAYGISSSPFNINNVYLVPDHAKVMQRLAETAAVRDIRPDMDLNEQLAKSLNEMIEHKHPDLKSSAMTLASIWNVPGCEKPIRQVAENGEQSIPVRAAAFTALAKMEYPGADKLLNSYAGKGNDERLRSAAIQSLAMLDVSASAKLAGELVSDAQMTEEQVTQLLQPFFNHSEGVSALTQTFQSQKPTVEVAQQLVRATFASGRSDQEWLGVLMASLGTSAKVPDYDEDHVRTLTDQAARLGDAKRGAMVFKSLACNSCHQVGGNGGDVGPNLTAIGTTLAPERIIEEVIWPNRQVKEGYTVVQVITNDGKIVQGYQRAPDGTGDLIIEDVTTRKQIRLNKDDIDEKHVMKSAMPENLTGMIEQPQLLDLIRYLSDLGKL